MQTCIQSNHFLPLKDFVCNTSPLSVFEICLMALFIYKVSVYKLLEVVGEITVCEGLCVFLLLVFYFGIYFTDILFRFGIKSGLDETEPHTWVFWFK